MNRGEIPVKVAVSVDDTAFRTPVIEKEIHIDDWREGIDMADVEFKQNIITREEAEFIRKLLLDKMQEILQENGYAVTKPEVEEEAK